MTSGKHGPKFLAQDVDNFLLGFRSKLKNLPQHEFYDNLAALARKKLEDPKGAAQMVERHWETIKTCNNYDERTFLWNPHYEEVKMLKNFLTPQLLLQAYDKWLFPTSSSRKRVSVVVFGHGHEGNPLRELQSRKEYITVVNGPEFDITDEKVVRRRGCKMM